MLRRRRAAFALAAALAASSCARTDDAPAPTSWRQAVEAWKDGDPIPDVPLVDQGGRPFSLSRYDDTHVLLGFVFTRCAVPEACPKTIAKMKEVDAAAQAAGVPLRLLVVTLDPAYDVPAAMKAYGEKIGADPSRWTLATGEPGLVDQALPSLFNVVALGQAPALRHNVKLALLAPGRRPVAEWADADVAATDVVAEAKRWKR